jgi:hypothetical protein
MPIMSAHTQRWQTHPKIASCLNPNIPGAISFGFRWPQLAAYSCTGVSAIPRSLATPGVRFRKADGQRATQTRNGHCLLHADRGRLLNREAIKKLPEPPSKLLVRI